MRWNSIMAFRKVPHELEHFMWFPLANFKMKTWNSSIALRKYAFGFSVHYVVHKGQTWTESNPIEMFSCIPDIGWRYRRYTSLKFNSVEIAYSQLSVCRWSDLMQLKLNDVCIAFEKNILKYCYGKWVYYFSFPQNSFDSNRFSKFAISNLTFHVASDELCVFRCCQNLWNCVYAKQECEVNFQHNLHWLKNKASYTGFTFHQNKWLWC